MAKKTTMKAPPKRDVSKKAATGPLVKSSKKAPVEDVAPSKKMRTLPKRGATAESLKTGKASPLKAAKVSSKKSKTPPKKIAAAPPPRIREPSPKKKIAPPKRGSIQRPPTVEDSPLAEASMPPEPLVGTGAIVTGTDPCLCGDAPEEHGRDPHFPGSTACNAEGCDCLFYEASPEVGEEEEKDDKDEVEEDEDDEIEEDDQDEDSGEDDQDEDSDKTEDVKAGSTTTLSTAKDDTHDTEASQHAEGAAADPPAHQEETPPPPIHPALDEEVNAESSDLHE